MTGDLSRLQALFSARLARDARAFGVYQADLYLQWRFLSQAKDQWRVLEEAPPSPSSSLRMRTSSAQDEAFVEV